MGTLSRNYFKTPDAIYDIEGLSGYAKAAYIFLCRAADRNGESYYSYNAIAVKIGFSRSTVIRAIKELESFGLVTKEARRKTKFAEEYNDTNLYMVKWFSGVCEDHPNSPGTYEGKSKEGRLIDRADTIDEDKQIEELIEEKSKNYSEEERENLKKDVSEAIEEYNPKRKFAYIKKMLERYKPRSSQKAHSAFKNDNSTNVSSNYNKAKQSTFKTPGVMNAYGQLSAMSEDDRKAALALAGW